MGCDPKAYDNEAIEMASSYESEEIITFLLEFGCDHEDVKQIYKYKAIQEVILRLHTFMHTAPTKNHYLKMEIIKRIIPCFPESDIIKMI